nr:platelet endothelial aggregation receptor 1-like; partial [Biomphalaria glabrata]
MKEITLVFGVLYLMPSACIFIFPDIIDRHYSSFELCLGFESGWCRNDYWSHHDDVPQVCNPGMYGPFCQLKCSTHCYGQTCDKDSGQCDKGCMGYGNPPHCSKSKCLMLLFLSYENSLHCSKS